MRQKRGIAPEEAPRFPDQAEDYALPFVAFPFLTGGHAPTGKQSLSLGKLFEP